MGHTLSTVVGARLLPLNEFTYNDIHRYASKIRKEPLPPINTFSYVYTQPFRTMTGVINGKKDYPPLMIGDMHTLEGHSTMTSVSSRDGKNIKIWFYDPHGLEGTFGLFESLELFEEKYKNKPWINDTNFTLEDVTNETPPSDMWASDNLIYSIRRLLVVWRRSPRYNEIKKELDEWRSFDRTKFRWRIPDHHYMAALFIFAKLTNSKHCEIISPFVSMPLVGPQLTSGDGICLTEGLFRRIKKNVGPTGACVVWSEIYAIYTRAYHSRFSNDIDLMTFLKENPLVGEISTFELLGQMGWNKSDPELKGFLMKVYNSIPDESSVTSKYQKDLLKLYDQITEFSTDNGFIPKSFVDLFLKKLPEKNKLEVSRKDVDSVLEFATGAAFMDEITIFHLIFFILACKQQKAFKSINNK